MKMCDCFGEKTIIDMYQKPLRIVSHVEVRRSTNVLVLDGLVMCVKVKCEECGQISLGEKTF